MIEWQYRKIKDFAKLSQGLAINAKTNHLLVEKSDTPLLRIKDLLNNQYEQFVDVEKVPKQCIAYPEDLIMTRTGQVGHVFMDKYGVIHNNSFKIIVDNNQVNTRFLYWHFNSKSQRDYLTSISAGSVQPDLNHKNFNEYEVFLPPLSEQQAIASVLSSLDDKIDLLHHQNKTLEAMAETLFRQWFIEEAKDDWELGQIGNFIQNIKENAKTESIKEDDKYVGLEHIDRKNIALKNYGFGNEVSSNKTKFLRGDILFGKLRPYFHKVCITSFEGICSTDILVLRAKNKNWQTYSLFTMFQKDVVEFASLASGGTRMPRIDWKTLSEYEVLIPPDVKVMEFDSIVRPSIDKIFKNIEQIQTLENLRDTLLPKLMSGEIRVQH